MAFTSHPITTFRNKTPYASYVLAFVLTFVPTCKEFILIIMDWPNGNKGPEFSNGLRRE